MKKSIKTQLMDFVETLPERTVTKKQIVQYYAAITGRDPHTASLNFALSTPDAYAGCTDGYLRKPGKERRHLHKIGRALYQLQYC